MHTFHCQLFVDILVKILDPVHLLVQQLFICHDLRSADRAEALDLCGVLPKPRKGSSCPCLLRLGKFYMELVSVNGNLAFDSADRAFYGRRSVDCQQVLVANRTGAVTFRSVELPS